MAYFIWADGTLREHDGEMDHRGFSYGDGFFSTIGVHEGRMLFADGHRDRLVRSVMCFELVLDIDGVMASLTTLARQIHEGMIKIIITRDSQSVRGYGYDNGQSCVFVKSMPSNLYAGVNFIQGIPYQSVGKAVCLTEPMSLRVPRFAGIKLISSHEQVFIHRELLRHQQNNPAITEGLVLGMNGEWISGAMSNALYHLDGSWHTPPVNACGVDGVMRRHVMAAFGVGERALIDADLARIDGLAFCNAVRGIMPIGALIIDKGERILTQYLPKNHEK